MTVADLVRELQALPQHWRVVMPLDHADSDLVDFCFVEVEEVQRDESFVLLRGD